MKLKDCIRLGKIGIASRKKSTRNTVWGISFGLIMILPVVFIILAFYADMYFTLNAKRSISCFQIPCTGIENRDNEIFDASPMPVIGDKEYSHLNSMLGGDVEEIVYSEYYKVENGDNDLNNAELDNIKQNIFSNMVYSDEERYNINNSVKIVESSRKGENVVPAAILSDLKNNGKDFFVAGGGFSENARGEVLLSEVVVDKFGIVPEQVIGKKFTLTAQTNYTNNYALDNDSDPFNEYNGQGLNGTFSAKVISEFTVAGVISKEYFNLNNILLNDSHVWISGDSVYIYEDGTRTTKYLPTLSKIDKESEDDDTFSGIVLTYSEDFSVLENKAAEEKMFFSAIPAVNFEITDYNGKYLFYPCGTLSVQCGDFSAATRVSAYLDSVYKSVDKYSNDYKMYYSASEFYGFMMLNSIGSYVIAIMSVFGGVVLFATLLNLYNSVSYSVQARKNYLGMMRAIGCKDNLIIKLYFIEILLIYSKSIIWVLLFGGGLSYGLKRIFDSIFDKGGSMIGTALSLNFGYFFISLLIVGVVIFLVAFLFSLIACINVTKKPVLEVLSDEK